MFQSLWKAHKKRQIYGIKLFNYREFKEKLLFLEGARKMTRIASLRESIIYGRTDLRDNIAAQMIQVFWKAYRMRIQKGIRRISRGSSCKMLSSPVNEIRKSILTAVTSSPEGENEEKPSHGITQMNQPLSEQEVIAAAMSKKSKSTKKNSFSST
jgi:hypothetical protein